MIQQDNPLKTKKDLQQLAEEMIGAVLAFQSREGAQCRLGETSAAYGDEIAWMEGFLRPLFGLIPLTAGGHDSEYWRSYRRGIISGTDPDNPEYWGDIQERDQRQVEMVTLGLALAMEPDKIWTPLGKKEKKRLSAWLHQINRCELAENNWLFFPVMVNLGLKKVGEPYAADVMEEAFSRIEECYLGDGWYSDGRSWQRDYYIGFAMHFYGLLYGTLARKEDPVRAACFRERAALFAGDFLCWFTAEGDALPYGRSLTYRFAMCAFWSAMAYAEVETVPWGVVKGIVLRNIRWWLKKPIFNRDGLLTIGYGYPNLKTAEFYNGPGSPAWAMKAFLILALGDNHPFWTAEEEPLPEQKQTVCQKHPCMILMRNEKGSHVQALTSGQYAAFEPTGMAAKYEKFAYSTRFGFSIPSGEYGLEQAAPDSMLALSVPGENLFRVRRKCEAFRVEETYIYSRWHPWNQTEVETWLIPWNPWHIRVHRITSEGALEIAEGAYSIPWGRYSGGSEQVAELGQEENLADKMTGIGAFCQQGGSGIIDISGNRAGRLLRPHPNTNILYPITVLPILTGELPKGESWLCSLVFGEAGWEESKACWKKPPKIRFSNGILEIKEKQKRRIVALGEEA